MKRSGKEQSITYSMVKYIMLYVLMPLFLALTVLCFLLQRTMSINTVEAYRMMFEQNVDEIDNAILQSNYASSTLITYTENNVFLKNYYAADNDYERNHAEQQIKEMLLNCEVTILGSFQGQMMILMRDGRLISSSKASDAPDFLMESSWYQEMINSGQRPYWDREINLLFERSGNEKYLAYGRVLTRYQESPLAYVLVRIPREIFSWSKDDERFQKGSMVMFDFNGGILTGEDPEISQEDIKRIYENWKLTGKEMGRFQGYFYMASNMTSNSNSIMYIGKSRDIFRRSEQIIIYVAIFLIGIILALIWIIRSIAGYITQPILFFADKVQWIEQDSPDTLRFHKSHFLETRALEDGMLRAQKRIRFLMEEVRKEAVMKEKARFDALKAQINPHFLFNTLNAIRWKASINQDTEVADILAELGILLGETYKNDDELETIDNAVHTLDAYVKIMQVRFGNQVQFFYVIPEHMREYLIPRFCLQPLVENSIIHGMAHMDKGIIALRGEMDDKDIVLTLIDNGAGSQRKECDLFEGDGQKQKGVTGIGLSNIHQRIQTLYGKDYGLKIDSEVEVGFKIFIRIPAQRREEG